MRPNKIFFIGILVLIISFMINCQSKNKTEDTTNFDETKRATRERLENISSRIDQKMAELNDSLGTATEEAKDGINNRIEDLKASKTTVNERIDKLGDATEDTWENFRAESEKLIQSMEEKFK